MQKASNATWKVSPSTTFIATRFVSVSLAVAEVVSLSDVSASASGC